MANVYQQQSLRRKLIYFGLIVALFAATLVVRKSAFGVESQAQQLQLREEDVGQVELTGSAFRLTLTGSRGLVVCYLWLMADEKKKKHEWNELELIVRSVIKLQPHFITPWKFQSWNLAYNVSVELDRVKDKYFYISRGIELLSEGVRQNQDNPELRHDVGVYTQNKFGISDENNTLRSLFQLSCIDPADRDPARFRNVVRGRTVVNLDRFQAFCQRHPMLVRRLHQALGCKKPEDVIEFLAANQKIPSRYEDRRLEGGAEPEEARTPLRPADDRFPVLPPGYEDPSHHDVTHDDTEEPARDAFDNYAAARAWYTYSLETRQRPRLTAVIFRSFPPRAQAYVAERREDEGWFDMDGWELPRGFYADSLTREGRKPAPVGAGQPWASEAWAQAHQMYADFGREFGLDRLIAAGKGRLQLGEQERMALLYFDHLCNYGSHYHRSEGEQHQPTIEARKVFYQANRYRLSADNLLALQLYEHPSAFGPPDTWAKERATGWKRVLMDYPDFAADQDVQEQSYIHQQRYTRLVQSQRGGELRSALAGSLALPPAGGGLLLGGVVRATMMMRGPLDDNNAKGEPFISWVARNSVRSRNGLQPDPETPQNWTATTSPYPLAPDPLSPNPMQLMPNPR